MSVPSARRFSFQHWCEWWLFRSYGYLLGFTLLARCSLVPFQVERVGAFVSNNYFTVKRSFKASLEAWSGLNRTAYDMTLQNPLKLFDTV